MRCLSFIVCCALFVGVLFVVCCLCVWCVLFVDGCALFTVCRLVCVVVCRVLVVGACCSRGSLLAVCC